MQSRGDALVASSWCDTDLVQLAVDLFQLAEELFRDLAPTGGQRLIHPEGELAVIRGAAAAGATSVISSSASLPVAEIAKQAKGPVWFQLYVQRHPEIRPKVTEYSRRTVEMIGQFIEEQALASGVELPYAPELLARIMLSASDGFQQWARLDPDAPDLVAPFLDLYMRALAAPTGDTSSAVPAAPNLGS